MIILGKFVKRDNSIIYHLKSLESLSFDKPVVGHDKLGAADHNSVDQDARFELILSIFGTESYWLYTSSYSIIKIKSAFLSH